MPHGKERRGDRKQPDHSTMASSEESQGADAQGDRHDQHLTTNALLLEALAKSAPMEAEVPVNRIQFGRIVKREQFQ